MGWYWYCFLRRYLCISVSSVQSLSRVQLFVTPWTAARQASLSITNSWSLLKLMSSQWCHPTISSSFIPFFHLQSFPASGSFQISQFFVSGGRSTGVSASVSVLPMNIQDWLPLGLTGLFSLLSTGLRRVFSSTTVWKHLFFATQPFLLSYSHPYMTAGKTIALIMDLCWQRNLSALKYTG